MAGHFGGVSPLRGQQRVKTVAVVVALIALVLFGAFGVFSLIGGREQARPTDVVSSSTAQLEMVAVLIPLQNIEAGEELKPTMFKKDERPKQGLPARVVRDFEELRGHYSRTYIAADAPLLTDYITPLKPTSQISVQIPDGYRAVTIRVDAQSSIESWARPGSRVDVVWATTIRNKNTVVTIVENAEVLSVDGSTDSQSAAAGKGIVIPSTVTLMVTAQDAQKVQLAKTTGTLTLTLRGDSDAKTIGREVVTIDDLIKSGEPEAQVRCQGKIKLSGVEYCLINGEMVPMSELGGARRAAN